MAYLNSQIRNAAVPVTAYGDFAFGGGQYSTVKFMLWWEVAPKPPTVP